MACADGYVSTSTTFASLLPPLPVRGEGRGRERRVGEVRAPLHAGSGDRGGLGAFQGRRHDFLEELVHLLGRAAGESDRVQPGLDLLPGETELGVAHDEVDQGVFPLVLQGALGAQAVAADALVQVLAVAAAQRGFHQQRLGGHEGELAGHPCGDRLLRAPRARPRCGPRGRGRHRAPRNESAITRRRLAESSRLRSSHWVAALSGPLRLSVISRRARLHIRSARTGLRL